MEYHDSINAVYLKTQLEIHKINQTATMKNKSRTGIMTTKNETQPKGGLLISDRTLPHGEQTNRASLLIDNNF